MANNVLTDVKLDTLTTSLITDINFSNNLIGKLPKIYPLTKLASLDMSNQNGKLKSLDDYSFDSIKKEANLQINLDGNDILSMGNKTFCTVETGESKIEKIALSFETVRAANKCILKQLSRKAARTEIVVGKRGDQSTDYSDVCKCDLVMFLDPIGIDLSGVCADFDKSTCSTRPRLVDNCDAFRCHENDGNSASTLLANGNQKLVLFALLISLLRFF